MKVTMLLADSAQAIGGKLYILGGGWSITGPDPTPSALALKIEVPWDQANQRHRFVLELLTGDGQPVLVTAADGAQTPIQVSGELEVGRPAGLTPGTPLDAAVAINLGPLPIPAGGRYVWRLSIDGEFREDWQAVFSTRPAKS